MRGHRLSDGALVPLPGSRGKHPVRATSPSGRLPPELERIVRRAHPNLEAASRDDIGVLLDPRPPEFSLSYDIPGEPGCS